MEFREWMTQTCAARGLTLRQLADDSGLSYLTVLAVRDAKHSSVHTETVSRLIATLGRPASDVVLPKMRRREEPKSIAVPKKSVNMSVIEYQMPTLTNPLSAQALRLMAKTLLGLDFVEPLITAGCFEYSDSQPPTFVTVEFAEPVRAELAEAYFTEHGIRLATHPELIRFGLANQLWKEKPIIQLGSLFLNGFADRHDAGINAHSSFGVGGSICGSGLAALREGGYGLLFKEQTPLVVCRVDDL